MSVREIERSLEQWEMNATDGHLRIILVPAPRERWYATWLLTQGWTALAAAEALERVPHTIGLRAVAFGEGGPRGLIFEQAGAPPSLDQTQLAELKGAVQLPPSSSGQEMVNW